MNVEQQISYKVKYTRKHITNISANYIINTDSIYSLSNTYNSENKLFMSGTLKYRLYQSREAPQYASSYLEEVYRETRDFITNGKAQNKPYLSPRFHGYLDSPGTREGFQPFERIYENPHHHFWIYVHPETVAKAREFLQEPELILDPERFPFLESWKFEELQSNADVDRWIDYSAKFFKQHSSNNGADFLIPIMKPNPSSKKTYVADNKSI